MPLFVATTN